MIRTTLLTTAALAFVAFGVQAETVRFHTEMSASNEVPSNSSSGKGTTTATLDTATKVLTYDMTYSGLTGPATAAHFHGPAAAGANAPVLVPIKPPLTSPIHGTATLTDAEVKDFTDGKIYTNVHTAAHPGGEIRGQLEK